MSDSTLNQKFQCKSCCLPDIFNQSRVAIRCVQCDDFELCVECFGARVTLGTHIPSHAYKIIDNGGFHLFKTDWSAHEHLKLLNAIERFGFGNWEDIAKHLNNSENVSSGVWRQRSWQEIKEEYETIFFEKSIGRQTWRDVRHPPIKDHTQKNPILAPQTSNVPPPNLTLNESLMLGYLPKRDDFEVEYDNECETLISCLEDDALANVNNTGIEDDELVKQLSVAHVEAYKVKLRERERRKRVAREHGLVGDYFRENPLMLDRKPGVYPVGGGGGVTPPLKTKKKDPTIEKLKILSEFQGVKEHQSFIASVTKEKDLKSRIKDLIRLRKNGIIRLADSEEFEVQRVRRNNRKKNEKRRQQQNAILGEALTLAQSPLSIKSEDLTLSPAPGSFGASPSPLARLDEKPQLSSLPGYEILSANEKKLCANLRLTPAHYLSYKTCLLTNHLQKKKGQNPKPLNPIGLDKNNRKIIFNFLMRAGWITAY